MQILPWCRDAAVPQSSACEASACRILCGETSLSMASPPPRPSHDPERLRRAEWRTLVRDEHGRFLASVATDGAEQRNPQSGRGLSRADRAPLARLVRRSNSRAWGEHHGALNGRMLPIEIPTGTEALRSGEKPPFIRQDLLMVDQFPHILRCGKTAAEPPPWP